MKTKNTKTHLQSGLVILTLLFFPSLIIAQKKTIEANKVCTVSNSDFFNFSKSDNIFYNEENNELFDRLYSSDGPFGIFKKESEIVSLRSENSKSFKKNDSSIVTVVGAGEFHYRKNGLWHTIVDYIHSNQSDNFPLANIYNAHQLFFGTSDSKGITFKGENEEIYEFFKNVKILFLDSNKNIISSQNLDFQYDSHIKNKIVYKTSNSRINLLN
jgi:hypothetical protein